MKTLFLLICIFSIPAFSQEIKIELNKHWEFRDHDKQDWNNAEVPGVIHTDLMNHKMIEDPFYGDNEMKCQWIEEKTWLYRNIFNINEQILNRKYIQLVFEGLDTYAEVFLNDQKILNANNMFRRWELDVKPYLIKGNNVLLIKFSPAAVIAKIAKTSEKLSYPDNERVFVRKAQYQFGWDWGPRLVTAGIWKPVAIRAFDSVKIESIHSFNPEVELVREKDKWGESFYFQVKGKPVFIKGANWIPADNFLPRAKKLKRYEELIRAAKNANINMLRVWGGGIYEDDIFYDLCDRYGIMVWQDFMFAGALYPATDSFLKNIEVEIRQQVNRLKHHPSIVIWCGNNEIEEAWFNWGWQNQLNYSEADSLKLWEDYKKIFHQLIPEVLKELDPGRPYWPSSPSLGWGRDSAYKKGDVHYWGVWWGKEPVENYKIRNGRFNSEYGMQGMPDMRTMQSFSESTDHDTASRVMKAHQKHPFGYENIKLYINNKFKAPKKFSDLVYVSQLMQADAIQTAIESHRSNMPYTMGTLFWQWNDCWPSVSWSALDYYVRPKAMYYQVKRSYADKNVFINQKNQQLELTTISETGAVKGVITITGLTFDGKKKLIAHNIPVAGKTTVDMKDFYSSGSLNKKLIHIEVREKAGGMLLCSAIHLLTDPKEMMLEKPVIHIRLNNKEIILTSDKFAYGVKIEVADGVDLEDNFFHLLPGVTRKIKFETSLPISLVEKTIRVSSLFDAIN